MAQPRPTPTPFKINVPEDQLQWITSRVKSTRIPNGHDLAPDQEWDWGISRQEALRIHTYWTQKYDWRQVEAKINDELHMFTLPVEHEGEDVSVHFVHHRAEAPDAIPFLFLHGWPGNFLEVRSVIQSLTSPADKTQQAYHVIAPSLPGFGFSSYPAKPCSPWAMAAMMNKLMLSLGYTKYMVQGGDWGSMIGRLIALEYPSSCVALHLNLVVAVPPNPLWHPVVTFKLALAWLTGGRNLTPFENRMLGRMQWWIKDESGYYAIQSTKPQTIGYALADSPFGMMCWIRDKLEFIKEKDYVWDEEEVITWSMIYILNGSPGHAEIYRWAAQDRGKQFAKVLFDKVIAKTPVGASNFPQDCYYAPRWWAQAKVASNIVFWKEHAKGGHFATVEVPDLYVQDIREFTKAVGGDVLEALKGNGSGSM